LNRVANESVSGILIALGILSASMGIHGFLLTSHFRLLGGNEKDREWKLATAVGRL
jgi:hypothetical protein